MTRHEGGCLCGSVRYATTAAPARVTVCHCRFCQRATGTAYMVEPIFDRADLMLLSGKPAIYDHLSEGSGKIVHVHFCAGCGTRLWLSFERFPEVVGLYAGTFDDPCWFDIGPDTAKHIFLGEARGDTIIPAGIRTYVEHATSRDGIRQAHRMFEMPHVIGG